VYFCVTLLLNLVVTRVVSVELDLLAYIDDHAWLLLDLLIARPAAYVGRRRIVLVPIFVSVLLSDRSGGRVYLTCSHALIN
jgi:hypothetical protein